MDLVRLIDHPELLNKETLYELRSLVALYPYYQSARLLMLKNMYLLHDTAFDDELRRAALYVSDRRLLFNLVEGARYKIKTAAEKAAEKAAAHSTGGEGNGAFSIIDNYLDSNKQEDSENDNGKVRPTPADAAIDYVAYLIKTEENSDEKPTDDGPQLRGQSLIDDFLNQDGTKIQLQEQPIYKPEVEVSPEASGDSDEGYFTETLAKIYIKQGRYSKALEIIQRLNLNYPKKNAYFADQIRFLKKLILNNKNNK